MDVFEKTISESPIKHSLDHEPEYVKTIEARLNPITNCHWSFAFVDRCRVCGHSAMNFRKYLEEDDLLKKPEFRGKKGYSRGMFLPYKEIAAMFPDIPVYRSSRTNPLEIEPLKISA